MQRCKAVTITYTHTYRPTVYKFSYLPVLYLLIIIIIIIQHLYSAIMSYADTEALVAPVKSE